MTALCLGGRGYQLCNVEKVGLSHALRAHCWRLESNDTEASTRRQCDNPEHPREDLCICIICTYSIPYNPPGRQGMHEGTCETGLDSGDASRMQKWQTERISICCNWSIYNGDDRDNADCNQRLPRPLTLVQIQTQNVKMHNRTATSRRSSPPLAVPSRCMHRVDADAMDETHSVPAAPGNVQ